MPNPYGSAQDFCRRGEACLAQRFTDFIYGQILSFPIRFMNGEVALFFARGGGEVLFTAQQQ
jgi:hypothetical protein